MTPDPIRSALAAAGCTREDAPPFSSAQTAWLAVFRWFALRQEGQQPPEWVERCVVALDRLYRQRRVTLAHARVLRIYGLQGAAPKLECEDARLWREACERSDWPLRAKGIVNTKEAARDA